MQKVILINEMDYEIPDIQGYMAGDEDYPVTDLGILRAKITKTELPSTEDPVILTSPLQRCRMAAEEVFGSAEAVWMRSRKSGRKNIKNGCIIR